MLGFPAPRSATISITVSRSPEEDFLAEQEGVLAGLTAQLEAAGAEVVVAETSPQTGLDGVYAYDPALVGEAGAILLRPGK